MRMQTPRRLRRLVACAGANVAQAYLGLYRLSTRAVIRGWRITVKPSSTTPGGTFYVRTPVPACSGPPNAYFRVRDGSSLRWSIRKYVCTTL
jgi:hypothetical protein